MPYKDPIKHKEHCKKYYLANRDKFLMDVKIYQNKNKQYIKIKKHLHYLENKDYIIQRNNRYKINRCKVDPLYRCACASRNLISSSIKRMGYRKTTKTAEVLGCSFEEFKEYIEKQFIKGMTWFNHGEWHIDHKIPLVTAKTEKEVLKLNHYSNLQPLWALDNLIKGARYV